MLIIKNYSRYERLFITRIYYLVISRRFDISWNILYFARYSRLLLFFFFLYSIFNRFIIPSSVSFLLYINKSLTKNLFEWNEAVAFKRWEKLEEIENLYKTIYHENFIYQFLHHFPPTLRASLPSLFVGYFSLAQST